MPRHSKRSRDMMQLASFIGEIAVGEQPDETTEPDATAVRRGKARGAKLSSRKRKAIAKKAAKARWNKK